MNPDVTLVKKYITQLQESICQALTRLDPASQYQADSWESALGKGVSCIIQKGNIFEKAGVNVSHVASNQLPRAASDKRPELAGLPFEALGISLVIHAHNPFVPTTHANLRFFITTDPSRPTVWWFGGGFDLTPYYGFDEDCVHWHATSKRACDPFGLEIYPRFKEACDHYFYLPHRKEARGIGGLFFDDYHEHSFEHSFSLTKSIGDHFLEAYLPIVTRRAHTPFSEREKQFQCYRRGRYVEFNLLYDRGTLFGLQSNGRTESILMSLPPEVHWHYNWQPEPGSEEEKLYTHFLPEKNWLAEPL